MQAHDLADAEVAEEQGNGTAVPGSPLSKGVGWGGAPVPVQDAEAAEPGARCENDASVDAIDCTRSSDEGGEESVEPLQDATDETPAELATEAAAGATGQSADELPQECDAGMVLEAEDEHAPFESTVGLNGEATPVSTTRSLAGVQHDALCVCEVFVSGVHHASIHTYMRACVRACTHTCTYTRIHSRHASRWTQQHGGGRTRQASRLPHPGPLQQIAPATPTKRQRQMNRCLARPPPRSERLRRALRQLRRRR